MWNVCVMRIQAMLSIPCHNASLCYTSRSYYYYYYYYYYKSSFSKIRVAYNNLYRTILHVPPRSSASEMFVDNNIPNFEALLRKEVFSFTSRLNVSTNSIENCWLIKYVIWKPWHIDKLFL